MSLVAAIRDRLDKLAPRERRLLGLLGMVFGAMVLLFVPLGMTAMLSSARSDNKELRDAIAAIKDGRELVQLRQEKRDAILARYANKAPPLAGLLEKAARDQKLDIPESQDHPDVPHGKKYTERSTVVRLRKTTMLQLAKMLETIEQQKMPISITTLNVRRRGGERDSYDVTLGVSAFDRADVPAAAASGAVPASSATPPPGGQR